MRAKQEEGNTDTVIKDLNESSEMVNLNDELGTAGARELSPGSDDPYLQIEDAILRESTVSSETK